MLKYMIKNGINAIKSDRILSAVIIFGFIVCAIYFYVCLAYNLQFYTEDERYIQQDMTQLHCLDQWTLVNYRVSSGVGSFLYYPAKSILNGINTLVISASDGKNRLYIVPMMLSKLVHTIMVMAGWFWLSVALAGLLHRHWSLPRWIWMIGFFWIAMLPLNIFLTKINNYDSIYNILSVIALIYFLEFILGNHSKYLAGTFLLSSLALQEKFAAYTVFLLLLVIGPFYMGRSKTGEFQISTPILIKEFACVISAILIGTMTPSVFRFGAEAIWLGEVHISDFLVRYNPMQAFVHPLEVAKQFAQLNQPVLIWMLSHGKTMLGLFFLIWTSMVLIIRKWLFKIGVETMPLNRYKILLSVLCIVQIIIIAWSYAPSWYTPPPVGIASVDTPSPGTYIPSKLTDAQTYFYQGANRIEYTFITLMNQIGFFREPLYFPILLFLLIGPILLIYALFFKKNNGMELLFISSGIFIGTILLVIAVIVTGIHFGGRYANVYVTLLSLASFINFVYLIYCGLSYDSSQKNWLFLGSGAVIFTICLISLFKYAPTFHMPGWGEDTSALVQACRDNPDLKDKLFYTYTSYTGLAIERPFLTPLINLKLIKSKSHPGQLRSIKYFLAESIAVGQNPALKQILTAAQKTPGAIVWRHEYAGSTTSWLIDLYKIGLKGFEKVALHMADPVHYKGEWSF